MVMRRDCETGLRRRSDGRWCKPCPLCGEEQDYLRRNHARLSLSQGKACKSCSNKITDNCHRGLVGPVRLSWVNKCQVNASLRGIAWRLDADDIAALYARQGGMCALTGWSIGWAAVGPNHTASLDRIDSSRGYTKDNVQLVHKDINMMKQAFGQQYFVDACAAVAAKVKW